MRTIASNPPGTPCGAGPHRVPASRHGPGLAVSVHAFTVPATPGEVPAARRRAARVLREWGLCEDGLYTASLVISELVGNTVRHAVPHSDRTTVKLTRTRTALTLTVHDEHPFLPEPVFTADPGQDRGRGLMIVDTLAREAGGALQVGRVSERGKEVRAVFPATDCAPHCTDGAGAGACPADGCPVMHFRRERRAG
ncbi:ATP-binding protein [Streptomyces sp. NPDC091376]|uniref:ATP-binding protein n=1 Tax=Streptomyces sp. NPDC091376 TaxID=3365994 RepID=UPI0038215702